MNLPRVSFIWHSPKLWKYAGLYVKINNKRYRVFKVGKY